MLPSSSTLTLVSAIDGPTTLARAFSAKRPNPPLPGGAWPTQRKALRKDGLSIVSVPSIIVLVRLATLPSKASFSGALASRAFTPERSQHHDIGDLVSPQQQRQQSQIRGQDVDSKRRVVRAAALQPDVVKGDVACGKNRDVDIAFDHQIEPGHGADLRLYRLAQGVPVEEPGCRDQAGQGQAEERGNWHPQALHSLGHRQ